MVRPITGTHVYTMLRCARAVELDLFEDRDARRELTQAEQFSRQRGRDHEARIVATLGYPEPQFPTRDYEAGARETERLLRSGIAGVAQGILLGGQRLGIPDLLRREPGASAFGDYHYVIGDVKSSGRARSNQVLQVAFYSRLLATLQQRAPDYGYLILKDGREERFELTDFELALDQVETEIEALRERRQTARPFLGHGCSECHWSELCLPQLTESADLSLLQGMTPGLREVLEAAGFGDCKAVAEMIIEKAARRTHLESTLLRQLKKAARSHLSGEPIQETGGGADLGSGAVVHMLTDAMVDRVLCFGLLSDEGVRLAVPRSRDSELAGFLELLTGVPEQTALLHWGETLPRWYAEATESGGAPRMPVESRFINVARRVRKAVVLPRSVFGLDDHVRIGLQRDPHRVGEAAAAAARLAQGDEGWLRDKMRSDLGDLRDLLARLLPDSVGAQ